jgi:hypothetical protein
VLGGVIFAAAGASWLYFGRKNNYMNASGYNLVAFEVSGTVLFPVIRGGEWHYNSVYSWF